jgi:hypothetical protein
MPRLEYFIVCRSVSADIDNDEITLSHVVEDLFLEEEGIPAFLPKIMAVSSWEISQEELTTDYQAVLRISVPGSTAPKDFAMNLARGRRRHRAIQGILQIPLTQPGDLRFEVLLNANHQATHVVTVHPPGIERIAEIGPYLGASGRV